MSRIGLRFTLVVIFWVSGPVFADEPSCLDILTSTVGLSSENEVLKTDFTGINGLEKAALLHFQGNMTAAYDFALKAYGLNVVSEKLKWPRLNMTAQQSMGLRQIVGYNPWTKTVLTFSKGRQGQERAAISHFSGDFDATFDAAVQIYGESVVKDQLGWNKN